MIFCFLDIETTGLDPVLDEIIEIAWTFTTDKFETAPSRTFATLVEPRWDRFANRLRGNQLVRDMHHESGLLGDMLQGEMIHLDDVADQFRRDVEYAVKFGAVHLAGFSVHFDRGFLLEHGFADIVSQFHHRLLDLSAVKMMLTASGVDFELATNERPHRAAFDVAESISQARIFRDLLGGPR